MLKRLITLVFIIVGASLGIFLVPEIVRLFELEVHPLLMNTYVDGIIGIIVFMLLFYWLIDKVVAMIERSEGLLLKRNFMEIIFATLGMMIGLAIASMISLILVSIGFSLLRNIIPVALAVILGYLGFQVGLKKREEIQNLLPERFQSQKRKVNDAAKLLDTSAIIDGRILEIVKCGFIDGTIIVPQGVLDELQLIADSTDGLKRDKGQRGLDILEELRQSGHPVKIVSGHKEIREVDQLLVKMAAESKASVITTDYNLNKVCRVQGIKVLNVNDLSEAIKPVVQQGDRFKLLITKTGKEENQGVGYLEDGTMVVVDHAKQNIGEERQVEVQTILQTASGRIIFTKKVADK
ncbi:TRAM domain-containing protein [Macrococcus hajekii]|uniref:TRAM domain-containing protein n=1 Tax=Macrococcus hajekii TaxID=198482 RepID=A0A4R6BI16_9STAP|nr:PIN domain-containing protein [Macrococcus hajekii]TDM01248.1 TRAM domain-containing protein [Macrococcus hajekii]GGB11320.1 PIN/TRAM domain-containing protein [Macrococcus hajekii]